MDNPFSWDYLSTVPGQNEVWGPFAILYIAIYGIGFVVGMVLYNGGGRSLFPNHVMYRMLKRWSSWALLVFGAGLFFFVVRALQINPFTFAMRFWMWLTVLGLVTLTALVALDFQRRYVSALAAFRERQKREEYLKPLSSVAGRRHASMAVAGKRPVQRRRRA
ncbi:MAG: hypothetical protein M3Q75_01920 [Gemmatimonadota bacterium]|nr:hypothetical protein [Gemmatimonadota bacterium]